MTPLKITRGRLDSESEATNLIVSLSLFLPSFCWFWLQLDIACKQGKSRNILCWSENYIKKLFQCLLKRSEKVVKSNLKTMRMASRNWQIVGDGRMCKSIDCYTWSPCKPVDQLAMETLGVLTTSSLLLLLWLHHMGEGCKLDWTRLSRLKSNYGWGLISTAESIIISVQWKHLVLLHLWSICSW